MGSYTPPLPKNARNQKGAAQTPWEERDREKGSSFYMRKEVNLSWNCSAEKRERKGARNLLHTR